MLLRTLQYKSSVKTLRKQLRTPVQKIVNNNTIKTVGLLLDSTEITDVETIKNALSFGDEIDVLCFSKDKQSKTAEYLTFSIADFGWKGVPKTESDLEKFMQTPFDLLISYYSESESPLALVAGLHQANLKAGIRGTHTEIQDITIETEIADIQVFANELQTYLHILNKL